MGKKEYLKISIGALILFASILILLTTNYKGLEKIEENRSEAVEIVGSIEKETAKTNETNKSFEKEPKPVTEFVKFYVYDEVRKCYPNGKIIFYGENRNLEGSLTEGRFSIEKETLEALGNNLTVAAVFLASECGFRDEFLKNYKVVYKWLLEGLNYTQYDLAFNISERNFKKPLYLLEYTNYVRPYEVKWFYEEIKPTLSFSGIIYEDLFQIKRKLDAEFRYNFEIGNEWFFPNQTLSKKYADCEDYSTLLLSLFKVYDPNIKCYNIGVVGHLTTFCKFKEKNEDYYTIAFYDQGETQIRENFYNANSEYEKCRRIKALLIEYYSVYGINPPTSEEKWVYYAFDDKNVFYFEDLKDFCEWVVSLG
ncbi:MAG: hypothetical protein RMJ18_01600 [Candidatus Aenigmarchaeota archaeon]|nr:hypothetical protein [Candidatus Aenigmarchaeota archaeon]MDW8160095.1 hypothetical protein [Candidatus Aenigmarchaeota archaeon]